LITGICTLVRTKFEPDPETRRPQRGKLTFSLATLMLVTFMCAVLSALLAGLKRYEGEVERYYILAIIAAPMGVMVLVSLFVHFRSRKRRRLPRKEEKSGTLND
jgi:hypothetical protein